MFEERQHFINTINEFISTSKTRLNDVLEQLDWSKESVYSTLHKNDVQSPENVPSDGVKSGKMDTTPPDGSRIEDNMDEGPESVPLAVAPLYPDLIASLNQPPPVKPDQKSRAEVLAELLKLERDSKRRRANYKNRVHTQNKSHLEILREVLAEQMATLTYDEGQPSIPPLPEETAHTQDQPELIEIKFPNGNPHLAWKTILQQIAQRKGRRKDSRDRRDHGRVKSARRSDKYDHKRDDAKEKSHKKYDKYEHDSDISDYDDPRKTDKYSRTYTSDKSKYRNDNNSNNDNYYKRRRK